jgi:hypothetical protein
VKAVGIKLVCVFLCVLIVFVGAVLVLAYLSVGDFLIKGYIGKVN